ncbi:cyclic nucleotide-binding domain-containing protein [Alsobacter sp. SYSU BS001988]
MALKRDIAVLHGLPLFGLLEDEALRLIAFAAEARIYAPGDLLFRAGEAADCGYVVTSGRIALDAGDGREAVVVGPGTLLGELALIVETERPATAVVRESASVLRVTRNVFRRVMEEFPGSAARLHDAIVERSQQTAHRLEGIRRQLAAIDGGLV